MFKNIGKKIKDDLSGEILLSTVVSVCVSIVLVLIALSIIGANSSTDTLTTALIISPIIVILSGIISYFKSKRKVMYSYAFAELVETVSKINILLAKQAVNQWQCPECHGLNNGTFNYCQSCGCKKP